MTNRKSNWSTGSGFDLAGGDPGREPVLGVGAELDLELHLDRADPEGQALVLPPVTGVLACAGIASRHPPASPRGLALNPRIRSPRDQGYFDILFGYLFRFVQAP